MERLRAAADDHKFLPADSKDLVRAAEALLHMAPPAEFHGLFDEAPSGGLIALGSEQEIDRLAVAIHRPVQILPLPAAWSTAMPRSAIIETG